MARRLWLWLPSMVVAWLMPRPAEAIGAAGSIDVLGGVEGGGSGYAAGARRTRTTLRLGADLWLDDSPDNILAFAALAELEPVAGFGGDLRYERRFADAFVFHVGVTAMFLPETMVGATFGIAYRLQASEMFEINLGPTGAVYFAGSNLPEDQVLWQAMLGAGLRVRF